LDREVIRSLERLLPRLSAALSGVEVAGGVESDVLLEPLRFVWLGVG
jgi:hypothetical protein